MLAPVESTEVPATEGGTDRGRGRCRNLQEHSSKNEPLVENQERENPHENEEYLTYRKNLFFSMHQVHAFNINTFPG